MKYPFSSVSFQECKELHQPGNHTITALAMHKKHLHGTPPDSRVAMGYPTIQSGHGREIITPPTLRLSTKAVWGEKKTLAIVAIINTPHTQLYLYALRNSPPLIVIRYEYTYMNHH